MYTQERPTPSVRDIIYQAFEWYCKNPEDVVFVADRILFAATEASKLNFTPVASGRLSVIIGNDDGFEVAVPYNSTSCFRALLARFGLICGAAGKKRLLAGKITGFLRRRGIIADKNVTERKGQAIECVSALIQARPGSPLYKVDAELSVRQSGMKMTQLHLTMQNDNQKLFLQIEQLN
jgi:hypothetical protein